jgi:hypothetical protein
MNTINAVYVITIPYVQYQARTDQFYIYALAHCQLSLTFSCWTYCVFDSVVDP